MAYIIKQFNMKLTTILLFLISLNGVLYAQPHLHHNFGIKAGGNIAKFGQEKINWDTRYSWHAGLLAHIHRSRHFAIQPELYYSAQGAEHVIVGIDRKIELGYLQLPVLFQYMTGSGFRFQGGPQVGFLMSAKQQLNGGTRTDVKDAFKKIDFGLTAGVSYVTKLNVGFDARYFYGLTDISTANTGGNINNTLIQLGVFYLFKHK